MTARTTDSRPAAPVLRTASIARPPTEVFAIFTEEIGAWWPLPTHGAFGDRSGGVRFSDGRLIEVCVDGSETTWAEVRAWEPPARILLAWHPGSPDGPASQVQVSFAPEGDGTRVEIRHDGWEQFGRDGLRRRRALVGPNAWGYVLDHLADLCEPREDQAEVTALAAAYDSFFDTALGGEFAVPQDGGWTAEQVVAHVALNDLAMTAVAHSLVHGNVPAFENHTCQDRANLDAVVKRHPDLASLVTFGRACAAQAVAAVHRLDPEQRDHLVPCRMEHDGAVVLDEARPWSQIAADLQAGMHLPAHVEQLQNLQIVSASNP